MAYENANQLLMSFLLSSESYQYLAPILDAIDEWELDLTHGANIVVGRLDHRPFSSLECES